MTRLHLRALAIFTEDAFVQHPFIEMENASSVNAYLTEKAEKADVPSFYHNHYVVECIDMNDNLVYIGYNDCILSVGTVFWKSKNSKKYEFEASISIKLG